MNNERIKIPFKRLIQNCLYVLKYAFKIAPKFYISYMAVKMLNSFVSSIISVLMTKMLIDCVTSGGTFNQAVNIILSTAGVMFLTYLVSTFIDTIYGIKAINISGIIQRDILKKASEMDIKYYDNTEFYNNFIRALERGEGLISGSISTIINVLSLMSGIVGVIGVVITIDPIIALFPFVACAANIVSLVFMQKAQYELTVNSDMAKRKRNYSRRVFYQAEYAKEMKLTDIKTPLLKQFEASIDEERQMARKYGKKLMFFTLIHYVFGWTVFAFYLPPLYMSYRTLVTKSMDIGEMSAVHTANLNTFHALRNASSSLMEFQKTGLFAEQFRNFMECKPTIENATGCAIQQDKPQIIEIKNLTFKYDDKIVLDDVNMTIKPGEKIAIVGHNGAGKTTLIKLLLRLYDPTEGSIYYGGKDIREYDVKDYRAAIGIVMQDFQIYSCSIKQNVAMGYVTDENQIDYALKQAGIYGKINNLHNGSDTILEREFDDNGTVFSGGERQKLAVARLFTKNSLISILDEPSSALDPIAEYEINDTMFKAAQDSTIILISHRLSTTRAADKIYLFENGRIIEKGSHKELMALDGEYARMFKKQAEYYLAV